MANTNDTFLSLDGQRSKLGQNVVIFSMIGLTLLAFAIVGAAMYATTGQNTTVLVQSTQLVFSALLPLFGTWVGTVLAFYFSKENLQVAEQASRTLNTFTQDLVRSVGLNLSQTGVQDVMKRRTDIVGPVVAAGKLEDIPLKDIEAAFSKELGTGKLISRIVVLDSKDVCLTVLHRSTWTDMQTVGAKLTPPVDIAKASLGTLLPQKSAMDPRKTYQEILAAALAHVGLNATLSDAKARMEATEGCLDVIVTDKGVKTEPLRGWITNVMITEYSRA